jgi:D-proline reductase (dithiol) PrdB
MDDPYPRLETGEEDTLPVDSFKFVPRLIATFYQMIEREPQLPIPWTPVDREMERCTFGLVTSAGLFHREYEAPFDLEREQQDPTWGDPTYREIPMDIQREQVGVSHLHLNVEDLLLDINIQLPIQRFQELLAEGRIGGLAKTGYSFMGYQGFPPDTTQWEKTYGPEVAEKLKAQGADCVFLTPA